MELAAFFGSWVGYERRILTRRKREDLEGARRNEFWGALVVASDAVSLGTRGLAFGLVGVVVLVAACVRLGIGRSWPGLVRRAAAACENPVGMSYARCDRAGSSAAASQDVVAA